jgi:D-3-phosphoglycerate dehydrogenase
MLFLVCARKLLIHNDLVKNGVWTRDYLSPMGHISGQTMGIIGIGDIGRAVGRKAQAFGLNVIAFDPYISSWDAKEYDIETVGSLNELAQKSDYISINCFHNDETHHMINSEFFSNMKETAYLINCARGKIVDEKALIDALNNKTIAGAGLDVFEQEPVDPNNPLLKMKNVAVTSHYASYSETAWERAGTQLGEEAMRIALGYWPMSLINPEVAQNIPPRKKALNWEMILKNHS